MAKNIDSEQINKIAQELWDEYEPVIRRLCYKKLSSYPQEAEDVVCEVYLALMNTLHDDEKEITSYKSWLYSVTRNLINKRYEEINRRKRRFVSLNDNSYCHKLHYEVDMLEPVVSEETIMNFKKEIEGELRTDDNVLLDLIYRKKNKHRKIAKKLKTTEDAITQRNYRLKRKVKSKVHKKVTDYINNL